MGDAAGDISDALLLRPLEDLLLDLKLLLLLLRSFFNNDADLVVSTAAAVGDVTSPSPVSPS